MTNKSRPKRGSHRITDNLAVARPGRVFEPNAGLTAQYAERFDIFEQIYPGLEGINTRLNAQA